MSLIHNYDTIKQQIKAKAPDFGFLGVSIAGIEIPEHIQDEFTEWLKNGYGGAMQYLHNNLELRFNPAQLQAGTLSIICVKAPYLTQDVDYHQQRLSQAEQAYVSAYALGRDYHKVVKQNLQRYAQWIEELLEKNNLAHRYRVFSDSAPVLETLLAKLSGLGWRGKNTLLIHKQQGSMYFLGEIFTSLPLEADAETSAHCGSCNRCMQVCPTQAIIAPQLLDARRCISYLTIENSGVIPEELRSLIGNRIYGCDDCQLFCPWNKFAPKTSYPDFSIRHQLDSTSLLELFMWDEDRFKQKVAGSAIHRIGYQRWQRNLAVGLGNAPYSPDIIKALKNALTHASDLVAEHIRWALLQQINKAT